MQLSSRCTGASQQATAHETWFFFGTFVFFKNELKFDQDGLRTDWFRLKHLEFIQRFRRILLRNCSKRTLKMSRSPLDSCLWWRNPFIQTIHSFLRASLVCTCTMSSANRPWVRKSSPSWELSRHCWLQENHFKLFPSVLKYELPLLIWCKKWS